MTADARPASAQDDNHEKVLTILEHLQELRNRVVISGIALCIGVLASIWFTSYAIDFLVEPARSEVEDFKLHQFQLLEYWSTYFRVALLLGIAVSMPVLMYEFLAFIAPGLTKEERRWLYPMVAGTSIMFLVGMAFAYYLVLPPALDFLLVDTEDVENTIGVQTYIDTVTRMLLIMGLVFQLPFVIMALAKIGVVTSKKLIGWWRFAILAAVVISAVVTPSIDPITQTIVAVPLLILYALGTIMAKLVEGNTFLGARRGY
jgi:sec-independent protein translocase protein TatC